MNRVMKLVAGLYAAGLAFSLIGCSSDNIPKGTVRSGVGVASSISLKVLPSNTILENSSTPVIATVKDELGNPFEGQSVIFTTNVQNQAPQNVAVVAGAAQANFTIDIADPVATTPFIVVQISAFLNDLTATTNVTVLNVQ